MKQTEVGKPKMIEDLHRQYPNSESKYKRHYGVFECPYCGKHFKAICGNVMRGATQSCGCVQHSLGGLKITTHHMSKSKIYPVWQNMKDRCINANNHSYDRYGGRGIKVCAEWLNPDSFFEWALNNGYEEGLQIDRIDNDGDYCPENCRWVDRAINQQNKGVYTSNSSGYKGVHQSGNKWIARVYYNKSYYYLGVFVSAKEAGIAYNDWVI
jgi:hypothetical protein